MSHPRSAQLVDAALRLREAGDRPGARQLLQEALSLDPSNVRASQELSREAPEVPQLVPHARSAWDAKPDPGQDITVTTPPPVPRDALELLADAPPRPTPPPLRSAADVREEVETLIRGARDLLELDDHSGAMDLIQKAADLAPEDPVVQKLKEKSEVVLQSMYESKLGRLDARPRVVLRPDEIIWLNLDHRAGFVLAQIDGHVSYEDLFSICGMSRLDTARILSQLAQEGIIAGG